MTEKIQQNKKRQLSGMVVSDKMDKTRVVEISRLKKNTRYEKYFKVSKRFKAHDENNQYHIGDKVVIRECKPMSKDKRWEIVELIAKAKIKELVGTDISEEISS
ncbi:MAG TPA: 30S ribosomal protein S17 [Candidatus Paceibacterota bacterium]|nr:30S ribosomal protein S17 [Candidatus Paceibacterota bacterium]